MPTVDPAATTSATAAPVSTEEAAPGFATLLARASGGRPVTLGEMVGLDPMPLSAFSWPALSASGALAATGATGPQGSAGEALAGAGEHPVVTAAAQYLGVPYLWGGTDPATGLDCSGLIQRAFADLGISVPRVSADQARAGVAVDGLEDARAGDLVYWAGRGGRPNHIGIYLGQGKMLHAPRTGEVVQVADVRAAPPDAIRRIT